MWIEYHRGYLVEDRAKDDELYPKLDDLASLIWADYEKGKLHLRQKRHGDFDYSYEYRTKR